MILVIGFGVKMFVGASKNTNNMVEEQIADDVPLLELNTNTNEENQETVIITAKATTEDEAGIYSITLPLNPFLNS